MRKTGKLIVFLASVLCLSAIFLTAAVRSSAAVSIAGATVPSISARAYTGKAITPAVTVKYGSKTLAKGTHYTISYKNNINVGIATATITGKGTYSGSKTVSFYIVSPAVTGLSYKNVTQTSVYLYWKASAKATGYQVFKYDPSAKAFKYLCVTSATGVTVSGLTAGSSTSLRVRPYTKLSNGKNAYGAYCAAIRALTRPENVTEVAQSAAKANTATVSWKAAAGATGYQVFLYDTEAKKYVLKAAVKTNRATLTELAPVAAVSVRVRAYRAINGVNHVSSLSGAVELKTLPEGNATGLIAAEVTDTSVALKWDAVQGAALYRIYQLKNDKWTAIALTGTNTREITGLAADTEHSFRVVTCIKSGSKYFNGVLSDTYTVKTKETPKVPDVSTPQALLTEFSQRYNKIKQSDLPAFTSSYSVKFSDVELATPTIFVSNEAFVNIFKDFVKDEVKTLPSAADADASSAEVKKYRGSMPVKGSENSVLDGLDPGAIDMSRSGLKEDEDTYAMTVTLKDETFDALPTSSENTVHGKMFDILYKSYIDACIEQLKNNGSKDMSLSMGFSGFKTSYHDCFVTVTVDKETDKVIKVNHDMNVHVDISKLVLTASFVGIPFAAIDSDVSFDVNARTDISLTY